MSAPVRKKKLNFTNEEIRKLLELYIDNKEVLNSKLKSNITAKQKKEIWADIVNAVNAVGGYGRTVEEITHKWKDLKARAKMILATENMYRQEGVPRKQSPLIQTLF